MPRLGCKKDKGRTARKPSAKILAARRREYAAKFFPYIEKVARRLARRLPAHVEMDDLIRQAVSEHKEKFLAKASKKSTCASPGR